MKKTIAIYCLDQDRRKGSSQGIFNYTRNFIAAMAKIPHSPLQVKLWVSSANAKDLVPPSLPSWMKVMVIKGSFCSGIMRLIADHFIAPCLELWERPVAVHYPKGWIPYPKFTKTKRIATIHDTIVHFLAERYPNYRSFGKNFYFQKSSLFTIKSAFAIFTDSAFSASHIARIKPSSSHKTTILPLGPGIVLPPSLPTYERKQLLVIGSLLPHKATLQTIMLLSNYAIRKGEKMEVTVTTLTRWPHEWGIQPPALDIRFTGYLNDTDLIEEYCRSKALVFLSEMEGFGMPALEAYLCNTPVCFRKGTAVGEILAGIKGGWDGKGVDSFYIALDDTLSMKREDIENIKEKLSAKYNWQNCVKITTELYEKIANM